jgi:hypothetical protein
MQQHGRDPRDDADVRHAGLQRAGAKANRSRRCLRRSGQARCSSSPVRVRKRLRDAERGRRYDHAGACGRTGWRSHSRVSDRCPNSRPIALIGGYGSICVVPVSYRFAALLVRAERQPFCLPCRRSWVRVPSAASEKCPLPSGFRPCSSPQASGCGRFRVWWYGVGARAVDDPPAVPRD